MAAFEQNEPRAGVIVFSQLPPPMHGSTLMTQRLIEALEVLGIRVSLVERSFSRSADEVGKFQIRKIFSAFRLVIAMHRTTRKFPNDPVLFFCTNRPFSFLVDCILSTLLQFRRMKQINYIHTSGYADLASRGPFWRGLIRVLLGNAAATVCLSNELTKDIAPWSGSNPIYVIPNTVDLPTDLCSSSPPNSRVRIVYLSNLIPSKGAAAFVELAKRLLAENNDLEFIIAGAGSDPAFLSRLNADIIECQLSDRVTYVGQLESTSKWRLLHDADILVFPSKYKYEAQPLVLIEAMAAGTAVVAYDIGGVSSIISDKTVGSLVPLGDFDLLVEATRTMARNAELRESVCTAARTHFEENFSKSVFRSSWEKVLLSQGNHRS